VNQTPQRTVPHAGGAAAGCTNRAMMPAMTTAPPLRLCLVGNPAVLRADGSAVALERRAAALLALVALEPGISRLRVASLLWPDSSDARRNLRQQLLRFRRQFGQPLVQGETALSLQDGLLVAIDETASPAPVLLAGLEFDDIDPFAQWLRARRQVMRARRAQALDDALARAEIGQRLAEAIGIALERLADEPNAEAHHRTLIRLHYLNQDPSSARTAFETLRQLLAREFDAQPGAETLALMQAVDQPAPAASPARVWSTTLQRPPRLVGRRREIEALRQTLADRGPLLLLGEAGMGKSRLLAEAMHASRRGDRSRPRPAMPACPTPPWPACCAACSTDSRPGQAACWRGCCPSSARRAVPVPAGGERLLLQGRCEQALATAGCRRWRSTTCTSPTTRAWRCCHRCWPARCTAAGLAVHAAARRGLGGDDGAARGVGGGRACHPGRDAAGRGAGVRTGATSLHDLPHGLDAGAVAPRPASSHGGNPLFAAGDAEVMLLPGPDGGLAAAAARPRWRALIDRRLRRLSAARWRWPAWPPSPGRTSPALAEARDRPRAVELADGWAELETRRCCATAPSRTTWCWTRCCGPSPRPSHSTCTASWRSGWSSTRASRRASRRTGRPRGDQQRAAEAWVEAAHAADRCLRFRESMQCFEQAAGLFDLLADAPALHEAIHGAVDQAALIDMPGEAYAAMVERLVATAPDAAARAKAMIYRLRTLERAGRTEALLRDADTAVALARAEHLLQTEAHALIGRGTARVHLGQLEPALADFRRVAEIGAELADGEMEGMGHASSGTSLARMGRNAAALAELEAARTIYVRHERHLRLAIVEQQRAVIQLGQGQPLAALEAAESALLGAAAADAPFDVLAHCALTRAMAMRHLGRYAESMAVVEGLLGNDSAPDHWVVDRLHLELAQSCTHLGRIDLAVRHPRPGARPGAPAARRRATRALPGPAIARPRPPGHQAAARSARAARRRQRAAPPLRTAACAGRPGEG
jgi:DNA-binding SARP family transcriptional activator/tetratricopeptide (TPR) repeat protein